MSTLRLALNGQGAANQRPVINRTRAAALTGCRSAARDGRGGHDERRAERGNPRSGSGSGPSAPPPHEHDRLVQPGLALPTPHPVDPLQVETKVAEDAREDLVGRDGCP